tara:strand:+ start:301 stop:543 length:243 start_codon:yes stop_codon:yes gene_type:complete
MKKIPIFKLNLENKFVKKFNLFSKKIFKSNSLSEGHFVSKFEQKFSNSVKLKFAITLRNGTIAFEVTEDYNDNILREIVR